MKTLKTIEDVNNLTVEDVYDFRDGRTLVMPEWSLFYIFKGEKRVVWSRESHTPETFLKQAKSILTRMIRRRM